MSPWSKIVGSVVAAAAKAAAAFDVVRIVVRPVLVRSVSVHGLLYELGKSCCAFMLRLQPLMKTGELRPELLESRRARLHATN